MHRRENDKDISPELSRKLSHWLTSTLGLNFAQRHNRELRQKMTAAMKDFGFDELEAFVSWLVSLRPTQRQIEILASHLTVGETYFFRERNALEILEASLLPALIDARRKTEKRLRFWSAGCSTGEEPYSLAILLDRLLPDRSDWDLNILATDINPVSLRKAKAGVYSEWSFRGAPPWLEQRYFQQTDRGCYRIRSDIRERVSFSYLNLSEDTYPSIQNNTNAMDFIFCRNVLMYFSPCRIGMVVERFHRSLLDGGCLIVSPVETVLLAGSPFTAHHFQGWTIYRKDGSGRDDPGTKSGSGEVKRPHAELSPCVSFAQGEKSLASVKPSRPVQRLESRHTEGPEPTPCGEAAILYRNGLYAEAEAMLCRLLTGGEKSQEAVVLLARVLADQGRLEEALGWCEEAIRADKCNAGLHYLLATILEELKRVEEAGASLKRALYLDCNFALAHFALANLSLRSGKTAEARKHLCNVKDVLSGYKPDDTLPESDGVTAARLMQLIGVIGSQEGL